MAFIKNITKSLIKVSVVTSFEEFYILVVRATEFDYRPNCYAKYDDAIKEVLIIRPDLRVFEKETRAFIKLTLEGKEQKARLVADF